MIALKRPGVLSGDQGLANGEIELSPSEILVDPGLNGRAYQVGDTQVQDLAKSLLPPPAGLGQLQAVLVRPVAYRYQLVFGYTRHRAALWLCGAGGHPEFKLRCRVQELTDAEAFRANVIENRHRAATNPVDDAMNAKRLREEFGASEPEIAATLRCSRSWLNCLKKLADLPAEIRDKVAAGSIPVVSAINLLSLSEEKREEVLSGGDVSVAAVRSAIRDGGAPLARSVSEIKRYLFANVSKFPAMAPLFEGLVSYCQGEIDADTVDAICNRLTLEA